MTEGPLSHYYGGRPGEVVHPQRVPPLQPAPAGYALPQYVAAQRQPWGGSPWPGGPPAPGPPQVIHHAYPGGVLGGPGGVHFVSLSHDGHPMARPW